MSHPFIKAIINPAINVPPTLIIKAIFYPKAPWKLAVSELKFELSYAWFIVSNHPIYCFNKELKYWFLHLVACLSPVMSQQLIIIHPATQVPIPKYINFLRTSIAKSTIESALNWKTSVNYPQNKMNNGVPPPTINAPIVPNIINNLS